jgi:hypothetical protein
MTRDTVLDELCRFWYVTCDDVGGVPSEAALREVSYDWSTRFAVGISQTAASPTLVMLLAVLAAFNVFRRTL